MGRKLDPSNWKIKKAPSFPETLPESPLRSSATEGGDGSVEGGGEIGLVSAGAVGAVLSQGPEREVRLKNRFTEHSNEKHIM